MDAGTFTHESTKVKVCMSSFCSHYVC